MRRFVQGTKTLVVEVLNTQCSRKINNAFGVLICIFTVRSGCKYI